MTCHSLKPILLQTQKKRQKDSKIMMELGFLHPYFILESNNLEKGCHSMGTTQYLGNMTYLKEKHGLYTGQPVQLIDDNVQDIKDVQDNPIVLALDKFKVIHQLSVD